MNGALVIARLFPVDSFVGHAILDGAEAAKGDFNEQQEKAAAFERDSSLNLAVK
jgi:hypothetical protein